MTNSYSAITSLHSVSNWGKFVEIFFNVRILKSLNKVNIGVLRNIFFKYLDDSFVWSELEKMFSLGLIDFSDDFIYLKKGICNNSLLSIFLFEVYLSELDIYLSSLSMQFNSTKNVYLKFGKSFSISRSLFNEIFVPLRLHKNILFFGKLKNYFDYGFNSYKRFLLSNFFPLFYKKSFICKRYKDHCILALVGSKNFVLFLKEKFFSFVRSTLQMDCCNFNILYKTDNHIFFLGFNIRYLFFSNSESFDSNLKVIVNRFDVKLFSRLELFRSKLYNLSSKRFNTELVFQTFNLLNNKSVKASSFSDKKFWLFLFQLESIRSFQFYKLVSTADFISLVPTNQSRSIKFLNEFLYYKRYFFDTYLYQCNKIFKKILVSFLSPIKNSFFSFDLKMNLSLIEMKKNFLLFHSLYLMENNLSVSVSSFSSPLKAKDNNIQLLFPTNYLYLRLKDLGFFHPSKYRPISNVKLIFLPDKSIIDVYSSFVNSIILWYNISDNLYQVKTFVEFLRESCFLTLCRKHNKTKSWAFNIYTSNLLLFRGLFYPGSIFPSRKYLLNLRKNYFTCKNFFFFDENFFFTL